MPSELERALFFHIKAAGLPTPELEHRFHATRRWRFDFAWPEKLLAMEVEGGTWGSGRHTRGPGFEKDCEKLNEAALLGWRVMRVNNKMVEDGRALAFLDRFFHPNVQGGEQSKGK